MSHSIIPLPYQLLPQDSIQQARLDEFLMKSGCLHFFWICFYDKLGADTEKGVLGKK